MRKMTALGAAAIAVVAATGSAQAQFMGDQLTVHYDWWVTGFPTTVSNISLSQPREQ